jgi:hypothetical protein
MKTFDKQKPHGTVHGDTEGRVYVQDNVYYDGEGREWQPPKPEPEDVKPEAPKKK